MPLTRPCRDKPATSLAGRRILVAEDEYLVARDIVDIIAGAGGEVVGPVPTVPEALALARSEVIGAALLDVNLRGEMVFPVIERLRGRGVPVVLVTGFRAEILPVSFRDLPHLEKPYDPDALLRIVRRTCAEVGLP
ncbi:hypothetical protein VQ02_29160 [Methylobacterium variabile]|jgi:DNA-binding response OmpR family regulator|uniref:Response regulatory domain-containing protein n=1 Tax=Methylobacterium variabile TaxID=298794 RepID=A0A0J6S3K9_9HYPH|nr:response regulator [Methylobacterium variabile]KMO29780.1 hypothetical protein VQ02_29160 [Methylobacterium variabile]